MVNFTFLITCYNSYIFPNILHTRYIELKCKFCVNSSLLFLVFVLLHAFIILNRIHLQTFHQEFLLSVWNVVVYSFALSTDISFYCPFVIRTNFFSIWLIYLGITCIIIISMSKKCQKEHIQFRTNVEQMSPKLVEYRIHVEQRSYVFLSSELATHDTSNNFFFTTRSAEKIWVISEVNARLDSS